MKKFNFISAVGLKIRSARTLAMIFAALFCGLFLASCGDDEKDEPEEVPQDNNVLLIGTWEAPIQASGQYQDESLSSPVNWSVDDRSTLEFNPDGTLHAETTVGIRLDQGGGMGAGKITHIYRYEVVNDRLILYNTNDSRPSHELSYTLINDVLVLNTGDDKNFPPYIPYQINGNIVFELPEAMTYTRKK